MFKKLLTFLFLIAILIPSPAASQELIGISNLEVDLWPEYDRPSVLVIYHITLSPGTSLPKEVTFRLPAAVGEPNAVAIRQPDGQLFSIEHQTNVSGEWELITFTATLLEIQLEYYDPQLQLDGSQKTFTFVWPGDYDIEKMSVQTQLPVDASNMQITPGPVTTQTGGDGMTYFYKDIGSVTKDQSFSLKITYQKSSSKLSAESLQVQSSAPLTPSNTLRDKLEDLFPGLFSGSDSTYQILPYVLGVLALVLIFGGGYWYWRSGRQEQAPRRRRRSNSTASLGTAAVEEASNIYCHQCGKRASPGDVFCRSCGTRLKVE